MADQNSSLLKMKQPANQPGRFIFIDGLRGLAALMVAIHHFCGHRIFDPFRQLNLFSETLDGMTRYGGIGVAVFFVISGFVITHSVSHHWVTGKYFLNFALRRSIRLDPPFWVTIALACALTYFGQKLIPNYDHSLPSIKNVLAHIAYIYPLLGFDPIVPVFWTLVHEVQFYVLFVFLFGIVQRFSRSVNPSEFAIICVFGFSGAVSSLIQVDIDGLCVETWYMFCLGVFAYWWHQKTISTATLVTFLTIVVASTSLEITNYKVTALVTAGSLILASRLSGMSSWFKNYCIQYLGAISYSFYLLHGIIGYRVLSVGERFTQSTLPMALFWFVLAMAVSIFSAAMMRRWVEAPSIQLAKRLKKES